MPWWNSTPPWPKLTPHHLLKPLPFLLTYIAGENMLLNKSCLKWKGSWYIAQHWNNLYFSKIKNNLLILTFYIWLTAIITSWEILQIIKSMIISCNASLPRLTSSADLPQNSSSWSGLTVTARVVFKQIVYFCLRELLSLISLSQYHLFVFCRPL